MKRAFKLAYDGRNFHGFQRQLDLPTIEKSLFESLTSLNICEGVPLNYSAAGRTDSGVSAMAQTVSFEAPTWCTPSAINSKLPRSIRVWSSSNVPENFNSTLDASRRQYVYYLHSSFLDIGLANTSAKLLSGMHDFHNLTPDSQRTIRDIDINISSVGDYFVISVESNGFSRELVRRLVSIIKEISSKKSPIEKINRIFSIEALTGPEGIPPAPPYPLILTRVDYPYIFENDSKSLDSAYKIFKKLSIEHNTISHVFEHMILNLV